jgi:hypothetical protein
MRKVEPAESEEIIRKEDERLRSLQVMNRFRSEPFILWCAEKGGKSPEELFRIFRDSSEPGEFLMKANFPDEEIEPLLCEEVFIRDYVRIREYVMLDGEKREQGFLPG